MIDLTPGYHQAFIAENCRKNTAFITFMGIYEWCSVPRDDDHYIDLIGLLYIICEVYMEDVFIHGKTFEEFMLNLWKVFERFQTHHITSHQEEKQLNYLRMINTSIIVINSNHNHRYC